MDPKRSDTVSNPQSEAPVSPGRTLGRRQFLNLTGALVGTAAGAELLGSYGTSTPTALAASPTPRTPTGKLTVVTPEKVSVLDVQSANSVDRATHTQTRHILEALVNRDPVSLSIVPCLATEWQTPDPLTWVFTLRKGVKFHDGGDFTSADVKASLQRTIAQKGPVAPLFAAVDTIETPDAGTVRIRTKTPAGTLLSSLTLLRIGPADKIGTEGFFRKPIGTGPFVVTYWRPDDSLQLEANPNYWGPPPGVKSLAFRTITEIAARVTALETGEIDLTYALPPDQLPALRKNNELRVEAQKTFSFFVLWFNCSRKPQSDPRVRQAMWHALDIPTIVRDLFKDVGRPMTAPIPSTVFGYAQQAPYAYDPARARQLLAEAGLPNGFEPEVIWNPDSGPQDRELAQALFSYWSKVGVRVKSRDTERATWLKNLLALNFDADLQTNSVSTGDADFNLRRLYHSTAKRWNYVNTDLDKILDAAATTVDQQKRKDLYAQANKIIWDDAVGIFLLELSNNWVSRTRVTGFTPPIDEVPSFATVQVNQP
jgi:peptide/nickel transport system substrate-binding protein